MCYNQTGDISTLDGTPLKLVDKFTYLGSSVASTEKEIDTRLTKAWTAINRLSIIWKSDLTDKMKRSIFQAAVTSILLHGCTTWTLTKQLENKLDGNYTRKLFNLDEPHMQDTAGEAGTNSYLMYSYGPPHMAVQNRTTSTNIHSATMWGYRMLSWRPAQGDEW